MLLPDRQSPAHHSGSKRQHVRGNFATALRFAKAGIAVFPCFETGPRSKEPRTRHGHHDATTHIPAIRAWWQCWPGALVGIPVGPCSGVWVLDVDGSAGRASLRELLAKLNLGTVGELTRIVARTPSGGLHLYFAIRDGERPRNRANDIGVGLDTRGLKEDGASAGYVIAPGSVLPDGSAYEWIDAVTLTDVGECA